MTPSPETDLHLILARQYRAGMEMLKQAITLCPEAMWLGGDSPNRFWHVAYHALFYVHLYLAPGEAGFEPWPKHKPNIQFLGPLPWPPHEKLMIDEPYSKQDVLEYHEFVRAEIEAKVPLVDLTATSGFSWVLFSRLELQMYNIRHLQHHTGQLADRLRAQAGLGVGWVAAA
jgi:hypothetical protein